MCEGCGCSEAEAEKTLNEQVEEILEAVRGSLQSHGGDVELVGIDDDNTVRVRLQGACQGCPGAAMTMKNGIEKILKEKVPAVKEVVAVN
ncbi:MAG TPA: NifU family protein [Phycisphaerales bacterium]|nr:NifU family protein [Phycisphaerales bacterium]